MPSSATEQYLLELVNDARLDPLGDATRYITSYAPLTSSQSGIQSAFTYFGVSGSQLLAAFQALTAAQPVAFSDVLAGGARAHDQAMITAGQQSHQVAGEADLGTRIANEGYAFRQAAENIYAYAQDMLYAQAGFMVDWGGSAATGGMQSPAGHRIDTMNPALREVGIGVIAYSNAATGLGPQVVTEDFGTQGTSGSFLLGAAYDDTDHDGFYSIGEGRAGLAVSIGTSTAISTDSGGWTLATALTGLQTVQLSGAGLAGTVTLSMALTDAAGKGSNAKIDLINGTILHLSASATVTGPVTVIQALGLQPLSISLGDSIGRSVIGNAGGDTLTGGTGNDTVTGGGGNDTIDGGSGSNVLDGGGGDDTTVFDFSTSAATISHSGTSWVVDAPGTHDILTGFEHYRFIDTTLGVLTATPADINVTAAGTALSSVSTTYNGPVSYLQHQYIWSGSAGAAIAASRPNTFLHGGDGDDALQVADGTNVLDGGLGSNFLVGATGTDGGSDTFFVDGRAAGSTWSTIVNFHHGDALTVFGFTAGVSTQPWTPLDGASGYQGATIHSELGGAGTGVNASVTFAGISQVDALAKFTVTTGTVGSTPYLYVSYTG